MERFSYSYSREEIYQAVWSEPIRDACKTFGVTEIALAKVCWRMNVPRPKHGYWLRRSIGQELPRKPLPATAPDTPTRFEGDRWVEPAPEPSRPATEKPKPQPIAVEPIVVPETLGTLHPCLAGALDDIRGGSKHLWECHRWRGTIPILVSEGSLDRALRVMSALMFALETRRWKVEVLPLTNALPEGGRY